MADDTIELADLLESYPSQSTPEFQTLITAKKEFAELASDPEETLPPGRGKYFKHQLFTHRFLRAYDSMLVISETGTGKSCEVIGFIEYTRKELAKAQVDPTTADEKAAHFKRVIVLVKGPSQKNEFIQQVVCKCSDGSYEPTMATGETETTQTRRVNAAIRKAGYEVKTYTSFANFIAKEYPTEDHNDALANDFADTIFWFDEAHNLLSSTRSQEEIREKERTYRTLWRLLHLALRSKIILSTATPMINENHEIGSLFNLILPIDGMLPHDLDIRILTDNDIRVLFPDIPFDPRTANPQEVAPYFKGQFNNDFNFDTADINDLEPRFRGKIGYIRAADTGAIPQNEGILLPGIYADDNGVQYESQLILYTTMMSEHQNAGYLLSKQTTNKRGEIYASERQSSNFVFPDGYWGGGTTEEDRARARRIRQAKAEAKAGVEETTETEEIAPRGGDIVPIGGEVGEEEEDDPTKRRAFRRYVTKVGDIYRPTAEFVPWLQDINYINTLSSKFSEICRIVRDDPGNAFVYGEFVEGSGAVVLGLCLEGLGFERYNESRSMFVGAGGTGVKQYCAGAGAADNNRRVRADIPSRQEGGPLRYALLTGETAANDAKFRSMMEAMNSYENRHGDYIKVLISSRVGRDGINVNNVQQIHLMGGEWNQSAIYQALSRGLRATSHEDLLNEERARMLAAGENPNNATIPVKIYRHAAMSETDEYNSVDLHMYRITELKDRKIKRIMRIMKQCSVGCQIHYNRNVRPGDVDGTPTCDYDVCHYECVDPPPVEIDYSTYDVLYADEEVSEAIADIVNVFRQRNALTMEEIVDFLPEYREKYLIMALEQLVNKKISLTDRFGYTVYLREDGNAFYLDRTYPTEDDASYAMSYYTQGIIAIESKALTEIVTEMEAGENDEIIADLENMVPGTEQFNAELNNLTIETEAALVEDVLLRYSQGERSAFIEAIMNKFSSFIFIFNEPVTELNKVRDRRTQRKPTRGRKADPDKKRRVKRINVDAIQEGAVTWDENTEVVYLHSIYTKMGDLTNYNTVAKVDKAEGRKRLLKPSEGSGWRDLNSIEDEVYTILLQIKIAEQNQEFIEQGIYGFVIDGIFRISDRTNEDPGARTDRRKVNRGRECTSWSRPSLIDLSWNIGVPAPAGIYPNYTEENRGQIIQQLVTKKVNKSVAELQTWPLDRLIYYVKWYLATKIYRPEMCKAIRAQMQSTGRLKT